MPVRSDEVATIVTTLEMRTKPLLRPMPFSRFRLVRWHQPSAAKYRELFRRVGAPWLWFSRLMMDEATLLDTIRDSGIEVYAVMDPAGIEVGMLELDLRRQAECELSYVGLVPELAGLGHGGWLMAQALGLAWRPGVERVWVHTCTLDHPRALGFYRSAGFTAISRTVETFPDPRLTGMLPAETAPHVPVLLAPVAKAR